MTTFFFSEPNAPIERLRRRVQMQKNSLAQAEADLAAAQAREGIEPLPLVEDDEPSRAPSGRLAQIMADAERRRRGLGPATGDQTSAVQPLVRVTAAEILAAAKKARGEK